MFTNRLKMDFPQRVRAEKTIIGVEIRWLSGKEKVPDAIVSKESQSDSVPEHSQLISLKYNRSSMERFAAIILYKGIGIEPLFHMTNRYHQYFTWFLFKIY